MGMDVNPKPVLSIIFKLCVQWVVPGLVNMIMVDGYSWLQLATGRGDVVVSSLHNTLMSKYAVQW